MGELAGREKFEQDIAANKGYFYSTNAQLSSCLAHQRITDVSLEMLDYQGRSILDVGCGDGTYTLILYDQAKPSTIYAVDAVGTAIAVAANKVAGRSIKFLEFSAYDLSHLGHHFDIGYMRAVLHHLDKPELAIKETLAIVDQLIIMEPNGYNIGLKILERFSKYHREHDEKSYFPMQIDAWAKKAGGKVVRQRWAGFVPCFCPDWLARIFKSLEPYVEKMPIVNRLLCAIYYVIIKKE